MFRSENLCKKIFKSCLDSWLKLELKDSSPIHTHLANWAITALVLFNTTHIQELSTTGSRRTKILMWTGYWWEFTVEVVAGPTNVHLLSSKKQSQLLIMKGPQALTISSSFTLLITALYCAIIGVGVNANNQIYLKWILTAQTHGTAQLNRKKNNILKTKSYTTFSKQDTSQELAKYVYRWIKQIADHTD